MIFTPQPPIGFGSSELYSTQSADLPLGLSPLLTSIPLFEKHSCKCPTNCLPRTAVALSTTLGEAFNSVHLRQKTRQRSCLVMSRKIRTSAFTQASKSCDRRSSKGQELAFRGLFRLSVRVLSVRVSSQNDRCSPDLSALRGIQILLLGQRPSPHNLGLHHSVKKDEN